VAITRQKYQKREYGHGTKEVKEEKDNIDFRGLTQDELVWQDGLIKQPRGIDPEFLLSELLTL
jgi:hypothetical protein